MKKLSTGLLIGIISLTVPFSFAFADGFSLSISGAPSGGVASVGTATSFTINTPGFTNPTFQLVDSRSSSANSGLINSSGVFVWTPNSNDAGTHNFTIFASDSVGHTATVSQSLTVTNNPTLAVQSLQPGASINQGQSVVTFNVVTTGFTGAPSYTISDPFSGTTVTNSNIDTLGAFTWNPTVADAGVHNITITATDGFSHTASVTQAITVLHLGVTIQSLSPGASITAGTPVTFTAVASGFTNPVYSVSDTFSASTALSKINSSTGAFSWTPALSDAGTHTLSISVSDSLGHAATVTQQIVVAGQSIAITGLTPGNTVSVGTTVSFSITSTGFSGSSFLVFDPLGGSTVAIKNINAITGAFSWTPTAADVGVHNIVVQATDSSGHTANATVSVTIQGTAAATPVATQTSVTPTATAASLGVTTSLFTHNLASGSAGDDVRALQKLLVAQGFLTATPTGNYGALTVAAVKKFQKAHGISQLGNVGPATLVVLNANAGVSSSSTRAAAIALLKQQIADIKSKLADLEAQLKVMEATQ